MDLTTLVRTLEPHVFRILLNACADRLSQQALEVPLMTHAEKELATVSRIKAIRCVRGRVGLGIMEAKEVVDREVPSTKQNPEEQEEKDPQVTVVRRPDEG